MLRTQDPGIKLRPHNLEKKAAEKQSPTRSQVCGWRLEGSPSLLSPTSLFLICVVRACTWMQRAPLGRAGLEEAEVSGEAAPSVAPFPPQPTWGGVRTRKDR